MRDSLGLQAPGEKSARKFDHRKVRERGEGKKEEQSERMSRTRHFFSFATLIAVVALCLSAEAQQQQFWGQRGHDAQHTHLAPQGSSFRKPLWAGASASFTLGYASVGEPVVDDNGGTTLFYSFCHSLLAINHVSILFSCFALFSPLLFAFLQWRISYKRPKTIAQPT